MFVNGRSDETNISKERAALANATCGFDWLAIRRFFRSRGIPVCTLCACKDSETSNIGYYGLLGTLIHLPRFADSTTITKLTMHMLLCLMGQQTAPLQEFACIMYWVRDLKRVDALKSEDECSALTHACWEYVVGDPRPWKGGRYGGVVKARPLQEYLRRTEHLWLNSVPWMKRDLTELLDLFASDLEFKHLVYKSLDLLLHPQHVLAITYNDLIGKLWRLVCRERHDERTRNLTEKLGNCLKLCPAAVESQVRAWLDASFDFSSHIAELVGSVPEDQRLPCLVLDTLSPDDLPSKKDFRSLVRDSVPEKVQRFPVHVAVVHSGASGNLPVSGGVPMYLPLALSDADLFICLPHLVHKGECYINRERGASIMALLCVLAGVEPLATRARAWLASTKGTWLPELTRQGWFPDSGGSDFVKIVARAPRELVTEQEHAQYERLHNILRLGLARKQIVNVTTVQYGYTPDKDRALPDCKRKCKRCRRLRSFTLLKDGDICGAVPCNIPEPSDCRGTALSHLVRCRGCSCLYETLDPANQPMPPRCWYCRRKGTPPSEVPSIECRSCCNWFLCPSATRRDKWMDDYPMGWSCVVCRKGDAALKHGHVTSQSVELMDLLRENPCLAGAAKLPAAAVHNRLALRAVIEDLKARNDLLLAPPAVPDPNNLRFMGQHVLNGADVIKQVLHEVVLGEVTDICNLCCDEHYKVKMLSACGNCTNMACAKCLNTWYSQLQPGRLVLPSHLLCAFCKRSPHVKTLSRFNREALGIVHGRAGDMRADVYYAWCKDCYCVAEFLPKECANDRVLEDLRERDNLMCSACVAKVDSTEIAASCKPCPGCNAPTFRASGCSHMSCSLCKEHWCWKCGMGFGKDGHVSARATYEHLYETHGGMGFD
jgi:hypothetical protein